MMMTSPYDKYKQSSVQTSTPAQLLIMLYDGAIRFVRGAIGSIELKDYSKTNEFMSKAQAIISELRATLNHSYEISGQLDKLYEYMNYLLIDANIKKESKPAEEALGYLLELRESWMQAARTDPRGQELKNANG